MRSALRDAEATPPASGWARLERELGSIPAAAAPSWRVYLQRIAAAAAVVLVFIVAGVSFWHAAPETDRGLEVLTSVGKFIPEAEAVPEGLSDAGGARALTAQAAGGVSDRSRTTVSGGDVLSADRSVRKEPAPARHTVRNAIAAQSPSRGKEAHAAVETSPGTQGAEHGDAVLTAAPNTSQTAQSDARPSSSNTAQTAQSDARPGSSNTAQTAQSVSRSAAQERAAVSTVRTTHSSGDLAAYVKPRKKPSMSLFAAGGVTGNSKGPGLVSRSLAEMSSSGEAFLEGVPYEDYTQSSFRHHQPLSFGLSVRKELGRGFSLESGVTYTLLWADVRMPLGTEDFSQKLHFIGVPLRVNWNFLERRKFLLYIGAGGMVETCVSAKFGSTQVEESGAYWSVMGALGAEYRLGGLVGIYFEPDVSYYFNPTSLRTSRTESPATFTLRLGVRLNF